MKKNIGRSTSSEDEKIKICDDMPFEAAEAFKQLRTNLLFTLADKEGCKVVGVTSSIPSEGKSVTALNLAYTLTKSGNRVLLIDGDMRLPTQSTRLHVKNSPGLSNVLVGQVRPEEAIVMPTTSMLWHFLPAGDIPPNPSELLGSRNMGVLLNKLMPNYDMILIDLPPINVVTDALVLSDLVDGVVVTVREAFSSQKEVFEGISRLEFAGVKVLGFVMTQTSKRGKNNYQKSYTGSYYNGGSSRRR